LQFEQCHGNDTNVKGSTGVTLALIFSKLKRKYEIIKSLLWIVNLASESFSDLMGVCNIKTLMVSPERRHGPTRVSGHAFLVVT
jgi:hypothetical protein